MKVETVVVPQHDLDAKALAEVRELLDDAFAEDPLTDEDWQHCQGGRHILTREDGRLVAYAAVVERPFLLDGEPIVVGYVEGVGVLRSHQRRGFGGTIMAPIEQMTGDGGQAVALSTSDDGLPFYLARGWRVWPGRTYVDTAADSETGPQLRRTPDEDDSVMIWPHGPFAQVGPDSEIACPAREGADW